MPLYEFLCQNSKCAHITEEIQSFDSPFPACEKCGSETKRLVGAPRIRYGGGLYSLDTDSGPPSSLGDLE